MYTSIQWWAESSQGAGGAGTESSQGAEAAGAESKRCCGVALTWRCCCLCVCAALAGVLLLAIVIWYAVICPEVMLGDAGYAGRFRAKAAAGANTSGVVLLGDSYIDYWDDPSYCGGGPHCAGAVLPGSINVGVAGGTCSSIAVFAEESPGMYAGRSRIVMHCGANDIQFSECAFFDFGGVAPSVAFESFKRAYTGIVGTGPNATARVLNIGTPRDPGSRGAGDFPVLEEYDSLMRSWGLSLARGDPAAPPPIVFLDLAASLDSVGNPESFYADDDAHLSPEGYEQLSRWAAAALSGTEEGDCVVWVADGCSVFRGDLEH